MNAAWESVRLGVCRRCIDGDAKGVCRLPDDEACPLQVHFEAVSKAIVAANRYSLENIVRDVRSSVCPRCIYGTFEHCMKRDTLECALERHMPVIVERIAGMRNFTE